MKFITVDCETDPFDNTTKELEPFVWGFHDGESFTAMEKTPEAAEYIRANKGVYYAHNGGKFDFIFLLPHLEEGSDLKIINGRVAEMRIGKSTLRDSYLILPVPLSAYQKTEIEYWKFKRKHREKHMREIIAYLKDDCEFLHNLISEMFESTAQGLTLPSIGLKDCLARCGEEKPESSQAFYNEMKPYYHGGRTECFKRQIINEPFNIYDINSAYPHAMLQQLPIDTNIIERMHPKNDNVENQSFLDVYAKSKGCFPFKDDDGSLTFPSDGKYRKFSITGWEYNTALDIGKYGKHNKPHISRYIKTSSRHQNFKAYVDYWYAVKKLSKGPKRLIAKLMLNAVYGKFAMNPAKFKDYVCFPTKHLYHMMQEGWDFVCEVNDTLSIYQRPQQELSPYLNVALSASITGFARSTLMRQIDHHTIYCDTDSIFTPQTLPTRYVGEEIGQWSLENRCDKGAFAGKKLYAAHTNDGWKVASKGVRAHHSDIYQLFSKTSQKILATAPTLSYTSPTSRNYLERTIRLT